MVSVWEKLNVRDAPCLGGKKVFLLHDFTEGTKNAQENHTITAMTEETENIDGLTDHWLQIEYAPNTYGWIFGGYVSVERGGPKYYIPEKRKNNLFPNEFRLMLGIQGLEETPALSVLRKLQSSIPFLRPLPRRMCMRWSLLRCR